LTVTNRKIRFSALQHGGEVPLGKVLRAVWLNSQQFSLEATTRSLSGAYGVQDPEWVVTVIDAALRIDRRVLLPGAGGNPPRGIPQHVKAAVWQRDGGRCVQCGADTYLEFDHIIPWSKGGASTLDNVQLLCRRCNLAKSDRI
jgi:HNH endonuclease